MSWPLATAGPAPSAAASQSPRKASSRAKTGGTRRFSPRPLTSWTPANETASSRRSAAAAWARASRSGAWRVSASVERIQGVSIPRDPTQSAWTLPGHPAGRGPAARSSRRGSAAARAATRPAVPSVEPSSITRTRGAAVCASSAATHSSTLRRSSRTGSRTVVSGGWGRGGGRAGARRRRSSVLSASPRRPAPRRRERKRAGLTRGRSGGEPLLQLLLDLAGLRETPQLPFGEYQVVAVGDLEDSTTAADQRRGDAELPFDLGRQTGGPGIVASARAVLDGDRARRGHASSFRVPFYQPPGETPFFSSQVFSSEESNGGKLCSGV